MYGPRFPPHAAIRWLFRGVSRGLVDVPGAAAGPRAVGIMDVGSAVATWLKGLRLLYDDECEEATGDSSRVTLSQSATAYFANGVRVALLLRALLVFGVEFHS